MLPPSPRSPTSSAVAVSPPETQADPGFCPGYDPSEERRLAYVAITRGMRRVTVSHCGFRRGYAEPSPFLADIPERNRVAGWLRGPSLPARRPRPMLDVVEARELLRRF